MCRSTPRDVQYNDHEESERFSQSSSSPTIARHNGESYGSIEHLIRHEQSQTRANIELFRHALLKSLAENSTAIEAIRSSIVPLSKQENVELTAEVGKELIRSPNSLQNACNLVTNAAHSPLQGFKKRQSLVACICTGHISKSHRLRHRLRWNERFSIEYNARQVHEKECPYYRLCVRKWSSTFSVHLSPFIARVVYFTFALTSGAGGSSIAPSLRYYNVVQRSKSPVFQLLDTFPDRYARRIYIRYSEPHTTPAFLLTDEIAGNHFYFQWDTQLLKTAIPRLLRDIITILNTGQSRATDSDEFGYTLLHVGACWFGTDPFIPLTG